MDGGRTSGGEGCLKKSLKPREFRGLTVKINSNTQELCPEETNRPRISGAARQLTRQPPLTLTGIIVGEQMGSVIVPRYRSPSRSLRPALRGDVRDSRLSLHWQLPLPGRGLHVCANKRRMVPQAR
jgi:hypothetical protein